MYQIMCECACICVNVSMSVRLGERVCSVEAPAEQGWGREVACVDVSAMRDQGAWAEGCPGTPRGAVCW